MNKALFPFAASLAIFLALAAPAPVHAGPEEYLHGSLERFKVNPTPQKRVEADFLNAEGRPVRLSTFRGKVTLLTLWATWCGFCVADLPSLSALQDYFGKDRLQVLAVAVDRQGYHVARKFLDENGYGNLDVYADPDSLVGTTFGTRGIPYALFFDKQGHEIGRLPGATDWMAEETRNFLNYYIGL